MFARWDFQYTVYRRIFRIYPSTFETHTCFLSFVALNLRKVYLTEVSLTNVISTNPMATRCKNAQRSPVIYCWGENIEENDVLVFLLLMLNLPRQVHYCDMHGKNCYRMFNSLIIFDLYSKLKHFIFFLSVLRASWE